MSNKKNNNDSYRVYGTERERGGERERAYNNAEKMKPSRRREGGLFTSLNVKKIKATKSMKKKEESTMTVMLMLMSAIERLDKVQKKLQKR